MVKYLLVFYIMAVIWITVSLGFPATPPRVQLSFKELLQTGTLRSLSFLLNTSDYRILHLDQDQDRLYVGSRDYLLSLDLHNINREPLIIHWPASLFRQEECRMAGKGSKGECSNYVRVIEPWNRTHLYVCGTGAFSPICAFVYRGWRSEEYIFRMVPGTTKSGKGKCPFDPQDDSMATLVNGSLYAGVHVDFMGTDAAVFRSLGNQRVVRSEQRDSRWLNEPVFLQARMIPDSPDPTNHKVYFFFRERSTDAGGRRIVSRIGRVCLNDAGGLRSLVNKWTTFLKARLVCGVEAPDGTETHFDELTDVFFEPTQDEKNPRIYGVFTTSGSVFQGSAVCVYSMADIRTVFHGPFAHRGGLQYQWGPYTGRVPYPRPGTCPGGPFTPGVRTTVDFPEEMVSFLRTHPLMYNAVRPLQPRPLVLRVNGESRFTSIAVDQVEAVDGRYPVLFLGTDMGTVQKVVVLTNPGARTEELILEEVQVFRTPSAVKDLRISAKRHQLYVSSRTGISQLTLHRCEVYGRGCADCCLARDPYCSWDGESCSHYVPTVKRRSRRQDVQKGDPVRLCQGHHLKVGRLVLNTVQFGVEGSSVFLECLPRSPRASTKWLVQRPGGRRKLLRSDQRLVQTDRGLLLRDLRRQDGAIYHCVTTENGFSQSTARLELRVLPREAVEPGSEGTQPSPAPLRSPEGAALHRYCQAHWQRLRHQPRPKRNAVGRGKG